MFPSPEMCGNAASLKYMLSTELSAFPDIFGNQRRALLMADMFRVCTVVHWNERQGKYLVILLLFVFTFTPSHPLLIHSAPCLPPFFKNHSLFFRY
jgi:hypothetical protein